MRERVLVIACGALAREIVELTKLNGWSHVDVQCLPAELHNRPDRIPEAVEAGIARYSDGYDRVFLAYADCGTGGLLDPVIEKHGIERLEGAHCYEFFAGGDAFAELTEQEIGTYYLTDFLTRHFDRLVKQGLGLDKHPELMESYFGNYKRLVYLAQTDSDELRARARDCADYLGLEFVQHDTGLGHLGRQLEEHVVTWRS